MTNPTHKLFIHSKYCVQDSVEKLGNGINQRIVFHFHNFGLQDTQAVALSVKTHQ